MRRMVIFVTLIFILSVQITLGAIPETISYQGLLTNASGVPVADGNYNLVFRIYNFESGGTALWTETYSSVVVSKGIFNVILGSKTPLVLPFDQQYWLGITVNSVELIPRIQLTSAAYSLNARSVVDNAVTNSKIANNAVTSGKIAGGQVVKIINTLKDDVTLASGANVTIIPSGNTLTISSAGWNLTGNAGTTPGNNFIGTTDNNALEFKVYSARALKLEPNATSPNIVGGFSGNTVTGGIYGATISGGGTNGYINQVTKNYGTIGGGHLNAASGLYATVPGGWGNLAEGGYSFASGNQAKAKGAGSFVWGDSNSKDIYSWNSNELLARKIDGKRGSVSWVRL